MKSSIKPENNILYGYSNWRYKAIFIITIGFLAILIIGFTALNFGTIAIQPQKILSIIWQHRTDDSLGLIIWELRIPRLIMAMLTGMALASVGGGFQGILRNPLADPYILGVSAGAALGACSAIALQYITGLYLVHILPVFALIGALISISLVYLLSRKKSHLPMADLLLAGVAVNFFFSAIITLLLAISRREIHSMVFWLMGDLSTASWQKVSFIFLPVFLGTLLLISSSLELNAMALGEEEALHLGVQTEKLRLRIFFIGSVMIAIAVSFTGLIGFVGLVIPHIARLLVGPDHRIMLPVSALAGSIFLIICDTIARSIIAPTEIPIGAITALVGAPIFIHLLKRRNETDEY
ncbi:MAG: iron ABC transporter permease [Atribacterota bacterium]|nr:iron ABC transporter permease [Atribacterota bacterium]MDD4895380.1 iron ABC transporter permease [Atribacterota bacterium]MDD5637423.1 iron ABC transporter permease [Atribacterota bacterium]